MKKLILLSLALACNADAFLGKLIVGGTVLSAGVHGVQKARQAYKDELLLKRIREVGITLPADDYIALYRKYKNQLSPKNTFEAELRRIFAYALGNSTLSPYQKGAIIDVIDQLEWNIKHFTRKDVKTMQIYKEYLVEKKKQQKRLAQKVAKNNASNNKKYMPLSPIVESKMLKEDIQKRQAYLEQGATLMPKVDPTSDFLTEEEEQYYQKAIEKQNTITPQKLSNKQAVYERNRQGLVSQVNEDIKSNQTPTHCELQALADEFSLGNVSENYGNMLPNVKSGRFTLKHYKQAELSRAILTPSLEAIEHKLKENGQKYNINAVRNNAFVIEVDDARVFHAMIRGSKEATITESSNLQQQNVNELSAFTLGLSSRQDMKDFYKIGRKLIEYNSLVCVY